MTRRPLTRWAGIAALLVLAAPLASCGDDEGGLFDTSCADIGRKPADMAQAKPEDVIVLVDVSANDAATAGRIADDMTSVLGKVLDGSDHLRITGYVAGGTGAGMAKIDCMDGAEYFFAGGNERRQEAERDDLGTQLGAAIEKAVTSTTVDAAGDARVLLRQVPVITDGGPAKVVLWSTFLSQGSDCLTFETGDAPSEELAVSVATRCADQNLLPDLGEASLTVVGAGSSADRPDLGPFGKALATQLCSRMADECDIR